MATLPNKQRNELVIKLGDKEFLVKPTFNFIVAIEEYFDLPMTSIVLDRLRSGRVKAHELATIVAAGVEGAGGKVDLEEIQEAIFDAGTLRATESISELLVTCFSGPKINKQDDKKK